MLPLVLAAALRSSSSPAVAEYHSSPTLRSTASELFTLIATRRTHAPC
jgi:hypothetical protein